MTPFWLYLFKIKRSFPEILFNCRVRRKVCYNGKSVQRKREFHYDATCRKIAQKMQEENLDSFLVTSPYNLRYLTNFTGTTGLAVITLEKHFYY